MQVDQTVITGSEIFRLVLRKKRFALPFEIELIDFRKEMYPGTNMPKSYESEVYVLEGDTKRRVLIEMNEPLRYMNYTFYQSSFIENGSRQTTVLAVVKNAGRLFPYVSSMIICIGILFHMIIKLPVLIRRSQGKTA